jgi:hypothetical protein
MLKRRRKEGGMLMRNAKVFIHVKTDHAGPGDVRHCCEGTKGLKLGISCCEHDRHQLLLAS